MIIPSIIRYKRLQIYHDLSATNLISKNISANYGDCLLDVTIPTVCRFDESLSYSDVYDDYPLTVYNQKNIFEIDGENLLVHYLLDPSDDMAR